MVLKMERRGSEGGGRRGRERTLSFPFPGRSRRNCSFRRSTIASLSLLLLLSALTLINIVPALFLTFVSQQILHLKRQSLQSTSPTLELCFLCIFASFIAHSWLLIKFACANVKGKSELQWYFRIAMVHRIVAVLILACFHQAIGGSEG